MAAWLKWHHALSLPPLWLHLSACCPFLTPAPWLGRQWALLGLLHTVDWQSREQKSDRFNNTLLILEMETVTSATFPAFISLNAIVPCLIFGVFAILFSCSKWLFGHSVPIISLQSKQRKIKALCEVSADLPTRIIRSRELSPPGEFAFQCRWNFQWGTAKTSMKASPKLSVLFSMWGGWVYGQLEFC